MENTDKYFFLKESSGPEIGTDYPQSTEMTGLVSTDDKWGVSDLMRCGDQLPNFEPKFGIVKVNNNAILTDVLSTAYFNQFMGKLLNPKALNIFLKHSMPPHQYFQVEVMHKGNSYIYYWLRIISSGYTAIDFSKSSFMVTNPIGKKVNEIAINSYDDYASKRNIVDKQYLIKFQKAYLFKEKLSYDFFRVSAGLYNLWVSRSLKEELERHGVTGIEFQELPNWIVVQ